MALSSYKPGHDPVLFYHALSSPAENWVKTSNIRNESLFIGNPSAAPQIFHVSIRTIHTVKNKVYINDLKSCITNFSSFIVISCFICQTLQEKI